MSTEHIIIVHAISEDGLPDMNDDSMTGRVAFIWNGAIVSGWPINGEALWEPSEDALGSGRCFYGVTHWVELPVAAWSLTDWASDSGEGEQ